MDLFNSCDHASVHIQVPGSYQRQYGLQPCPRTESPLFPIRLFQKRTLVVMGFSMADRDSVQR
jgi:hypothetical protein